MISRMLSIKHDRFNNLSDRRQDSQLIVCKQKKTSTFLIEMSMHNTTNYSTSNLPFFSVKPSPPIMNNARLSTIFFMNDAFFPVTFLSKTTPIASSEPNEQTLPFKSGTNSFV